MARPDIIQKTESKGQSFPDLLEQYSNDRTMEPEHIAGALGVSVPTLLRQAKKFGYRIVTTRRLERG